MSFPLPTTGNICLGYRFKKLPITSQNWNRAIMASRERTEHANRLTMKWTFHMDTVWTVNELPL